MDRRRINIRIHYYDNEDIAQSVVIKNVTAIFFEEG
jgi:hypothetical protein